jgi:hypothetical protein
MSELPEETMKQETAAEALGEPEQAEAQEANSAPKRRGRPKTAPSLDEKPVGGDAPKRARASNAKKNVFSDESKNKLAVQLMGIHHIAAHATGLPELQINEKEAVMLAESIATLAAEYDLSLSGKTGAALQLMGVAAVIYYPRFKAVQQRAREQNATVINPEMGAANV